MPSYELDERKGVVRMNRATLAACRAACRWAREEYFTCDVFFAGIHLRVSYKEYYAVRSYTIECILEFPEPWTTHTVSTTKYNADLTARFMLSVLKGEV